LNFVKSNIIINQIIEVAQEWFGLLQIGYTRVKNDYKWGDYRLTSSQIVYVVHNNSEYRILQLAFQLGSYSRFYISDNSCQRNLIYLVINSPRVQIWIIPYEVEKFQLVLIINRIEAKACRLLVEARVKTNLVLGIQTECVKQAACVAVAGQISWIQTPRNAEFVCFTFFTALLETRIEMFA